MKIKTALELLLKEFMDPTPQSRKSKGYPGMCVAADTLHEKASLVSLNYLYRNMPDKRYDGNVGVRLYCWPMYNKELRIEWLRNHIILNS